MEITHVTNALFSIPFALSCWSKTSTSSITCIFIHSFPWLNNCTYKTSKWVDLGHYIFTWFGFLFWWSLILVVCLFECHIPIKLLTKSKLLSILPNLLNRLWFLLFVSFLLASLSCLDLFCILLSLTWLLPKMKCLYRTNRPNIRPLFCNCNAFLLKHELVFNSVHVCISLHHFRIVVFRSNPRNLWIFKFANRRFCDVNCLQKSILSKSNEIRTWL